ncbi:hypothetical protein ROS1_59850 [Roseibium sp. ROS1]
MDAVVELSALSMLLSLIAGLVMFAVRNWRSCAKWAFALSGLSFLVSFGSSAGILSSAALAVLISLGGLVASLFMMIMPRLRVRAKKTLTISFGVLVAGTVAIVGLQEPAQLKKNGHEIAAAKKPDLNLLSPGTQQTEPPKPKVTALPLRNEENPPTDTGNTKFATETMYVDATRLNVRSGPSKSHKVIWTLKDNEKVFVIGRENGWAYLRGERYQGWVFATYLTPKPDAYQTVDQHKPTKLTSKPNPALSDSQIAKILIERSLAYYQGNCPCPYNRARNGSRCGGRSAYSRPGGASPLCFVRDVTKTMIADYRARN